MGLCLIQVLITVFLSPTCHTLVRGLLYIATSTGLTTGMFQVLPSNSDLSHNLLTWAELLCVEFQIQLAYWQTWQLVHAGNLRNSQGYFLWRLECKDSSLLTCLSDQLNDFIMAESTQGKLQSEWKHKLEDTIIMRCLQEHLLFNCLFEESCVEVGYYLTIEETNTV